MPAEYQPLFIIGSPRSGTTMLQVLLGEHPQVSTTVELTVFRRYVAPWLDTWDEEKRNSAEGRWHQGLPFVWERDETAAYLKGFVDGVYTKLLARKAGATHILDKHPTNALFLPLIREFLPHARFIHVIRDGRDVACSMISAAQKIGYGTHTIRDSALAWKKHVLAAREGKCYKKDYHEVRYERLINDTTAHREILEFCGLSYDENWVKTVLEENTFEKMKAARRTGDASVKSSEAHYRSGRAGGWKDSFSNLDAFEFERLAGDLLRELGYETSTGWWKRSPLAGFITPAMAAARRKFKSALPLFARKAAA